MKINNINGVSYKGIQNVAGAEFAAGDFSSSFLTVKLNNDENGNDLDRFSKLLDKSGVEKDTLTISSLSALNPKSGEVFKNIFLNGVPILNKNLCDLSVPLPMPISSVDAFLPLYTLLAEITKRVKNGEGAKQDKSSEGFINCIENTCQYIDYYFDDFPQERNEVICSLLESDAVDIPAKTINDDIVGIMEDYFA